MKMYKMSEVLINAEKLKKFLKDSFSWLVVRRDNKIYELESRIKVLEEKQV